MTSFRTPQTGIPRPGWLYAAIEYCRELAFSFVIGFLRGQLINHGTPPLLTVNQSNPIAPFALIATHSQQRLLKQIDILTSRIIQHFVVILGSPSSLRPHVGFEEPRVVRVHERGNQFIDRSDPLAHQS